MSVDESHPRNGFNSLLRAEAEAVLAQPVFLRSPILSKLLRYLVAETANGRSNTMKSFVVATEGLGRPANFDAASDSSARVQMVRLRKTLESHYAQHGAIAELCIYLLPGSYTVRLAKPAVAYPMLYRPLSDPAPQPGPTASPDVHLLPSESEPAGITSPARPTSRSPHSRRNLIYIVAFLAAIAIAVFGLSTWRKANSTNISFNSPILELLPVDSAGSAEAVRTARLVSSMFADNLPRFKLSRVRIVNVQPQDGQPVTTENVYRLSSRLEDDMQGGQTLFLNLSDAQTGIGFWSREIALPSEGPPSDAIIPILGEINGPFGVIASHGAALYKESNKGGYPCLLKYFQFVETRESDIERKVAKCFEKPVSEIHLQSTILAARALFAIERDGASANFAAATKQGMAFARAAVAADPNDSSANFAVARLSYFENDCVSARFYTRRALDSNSSSPMITATLASLAGLCNYPDAEGLLDEAFRLQSPRYTKGRLLLVLASLAQNRPEMIGQIKESDLPPTRYNRVNYYLAEALIAASQNRRDDTARNWQAFSRIVPQGRRTADEKLSGLIVLPKMRAKVIALLEQGGAFGTTG